MEGGGASWITVFRMENCGLVELKLTDMVLEVLEGMSLNPGTVLLLSSISYLHKVGESLSAKEWVCCGLRSRLE
jgi:hypothetical protein